MESCVLDRPVLVLNRSWTPIRITPLAEALGVLTGHARHEPPKAEIYDPETYRLMRWEEWEEVEPAPGEASLRSAVRSFRIPEIMRVLNFDRVYQGRSTFSRTNLLRRDRHECQYCGTRLTIRDLTVDHIVPRAQGGGTTWDNCVASCGPCNSKKANRTPDQAGMKLRSAPVRPRFSSLVFDTVRYESWRPFLDGVRAGSY